MNVLCLQQKDHQHDSASTTLFFWLQFFFSVLVSLPQRDMSDEKGGRGGGGV